MNKTATAALVALGLGTWGVSASASTPDNYYPSTIALLPQPVRIIDTRETGTTERVHMPDRPYWGNHVIANVAVVGAPRSGYATVWDCVTFPDVSNLNYDASAAQANLVIAPLSPEGDLCVFLSQGGDFVIDLVGWAASTGYSYVP